MSCSSLPNSASSSLWFLLSTRSRRCFSLKSSVSSVIFVPPGENFAVTVWPEVAPGTNCCGFRAMRLPMTGWSRMSSSLSLSEEGARRSSSELSAIALSPRARARVCPLCGCVCVCVARALFRSLALVHQQARRLCTLHTRQDL